MVSSLFKRFKQKGGGGEKPRNKSEKTETLGENAHSNARTHSHAQTHTPIYSLARSTIIVVIATSKAKQNLLHRPLPYATTHASLFGDLQKSDTKKGKKITAKTGSSK